MAELTRKEEQILLAVHALKDNASLMPVRDWIHEHTGTDFAAGTVYAPLNRLFLRGYLESDLARDPAGGKAVRYYRVSRRGYEALAELERQRSTMWADFVNPVVGEEEV